MNPWLLWLLWPSLMLAVGVVAGWLSRRLPMSGAAALILATVPLAGAGLVGMC